MEKNIKLTSTELLILQTLLEDAPLDRFNKWSDEKGAPMTDDYLSNLYDKLQPGVIYG